MARVRVYCAVSLDGFVAGPDNELDWLESGAPPDQAPEGTMDFGPFLDEIGSMLMGRTTFDVVAGMDHPWPYGEIPVLVATHRPLASDIPTVRAAAGSIGTLCREAQELAGDGDVYLDGGALITAALDANLVHEVILTTIPVWLGAGVPLYQGQQRHHWTVVHTARYGDFVQHRLEPRP